MKKILFLATLISLVLGLGSCSDSDKTPDGPFAGEFKVGVTELTFLKTAATQTLYVAAPSKPAVTSDAEWLTVGDIALNGESSSVYAVAVNVTDNNVYDNRTGNLKITCGANEATVKVTQRNSDGILLADGYAAPEVKADGETLEIPVLATGEYTATVSDTWMEIVPAPVRGLVESKLYVKVAANYRAEAREGSVTIALDSDDTQSVTVAIKQAATASTGQCDETAFQTAANISMAINIGNTLEAIGGETAWGAAKINADYIRSIRESGFDAVRLPVAWYNHSDKNTLKIDESWMNRVDEVVQLCIANGLYVFMNIHWDEGWMELNIDSYSPDVDRIQRELWTQIADRFKDYDKHLVFCGANEAGQDTQASADALKAYMQTFIDVVRASGSNNANRVLVVQSPGTDIDRAVKYCAGNLPKDKVADRMMLEVHCYDPSDFTILQNDGEWGANSKVRYFWGQDYHTGTDRDCTWGEENHIDTQMQKLKTNFVDNGIPVIIGEFGCGRRRSFVATIDEAKHRASRCYYHSYIVKSAKTNGAVPFLWDTPNEMFNRQTGAVIDPDNLAAIQQGAANGKYPY
jgi:endoglucanase